MKSTNTMFDGAKMTQAERLKKRLAILQINLFAGYPPKKKERNILVGRISVLKNQIRLAELRNSNHE